MNIDKAEIPKPNLSIATNVVVVISTVFGFFSRREESILRFLLLLALLHFWRVFHRWSPREAISFIDHPKEIRGRWEKVFSTCALQMKDQDLAAYKVDDRGVPRAEGGLTGWQNLNLVIKKRNPLLWYFYGALGIPTYFNTLSSNHFL